MVSTQKGGLNCENIYVYPHYLVRNGIVYAFGHYAYDRL